MLDVGDIAPALSRQPVFGHPVTLPGGASGPRQGHLVVFVGHLVEAQARGLLSSLQARVREADARGIGIVALTTASMELAQDFVPRYHLLLPLLVDPEGALHNEWRVPQRSGARARLKALVGGSPDGWMEALTLGLGREATASHRAVAYRLAADGRVLAVSSQASPGGLDLDAMLSCAAS